MILTSHNSKTKPQLKKTPKNTLLLRITTTTAGDCSRRPPPAASSPVPRRQPPISPPELEFIHKSNCTVGYRPNVFSTTLSRLIATNCANLIMPFIPIREMVKEKVEAFFGCEFELFVEFTGLFR
ncbi:hypothetical protein RND81_03G159700 [Saponaria officinalis]|uniref:Uncharacterized protein n=1 Tax=Saponaria officinalis TaxID=3572 RepID=A0AAW1M7G5_SAPOF